MDYKYYLMKKDNDVVFLLLILDECCVKGLLFEWLKI